uniref:G-patch domain-containing protein n=1 Tax=Echinostoma caproni TaxID=27848 RepID=A0A183ATR7_9TREM
LHVENLNKLRIKHGLRPIPVPSASGAAASSSVPDRAKERREKYGIPSPPRSKYVDELQAVQRSNVGSRLMEKMGWQAGQGLGRANQGRTQLVEAEFREQGVGLGIKTSKRGPPSDNYKDHVKRAMFARFHELE